ncbi:type II secretion system protein, partial [bacterium]|nr:type II secretion system protein [bacterium]
MKNQKGFTLLALVIIVIVASLVAAVSMELISVSEEDRMRELTLERIKEIQEAIYGDTEIYPQTDFGYVADIGDLPSSLDDLINDTGDPNWNGPYLTTDFSDANPEDQLDDASGTELVYDPDAGTIGTADGSSIDIPPQQFQFDPEELTNATLCGTVTDIDGNIPQASDLENIYISLVYTINKEAEEEEEEEPDIPRQKWRPFWWMWDTAIDNNYNWKWKPNSRRWWGGSQGDWWHEGIDPWWEQDREYEPPLGVWKNWWQSSTDHSWWSNMTQYYPHQKKWAFWWWWRHKCKDRNDPPPDTETYGRFVTINPNADGTFCFNDIAIGNYTVEATHDLLGISQEKPAAVLPSVDNTVNFRFPADMPGYEGYGED